MIAASDYEGLISVLLENRSDVSTTLRDGRCYVQLIPVAFNNRGFEITRAPTEPTVEKDGGFDEMERQGEEEAVDQEFESSQQLGGSG